MQLVSAGFQAKHDILRIKNPAILLCFAASAMTLAITPAVLADVVVSQPLALTHRVQVQPIRVKKADGTTAVTLGDTSQSNYIKQQVDRIWAQVGVRIDWLPFNDYTNDFAYDGSPTNYTTTARPGNHLSQTVSAAGSPPKSGNPNIINLFFVEIVPGFNKRSDNTANGLAFIDMNGIAMHVGANLLGFQGGRDVVASVLAHEIGHNVGLDHVSEDENLMNGAGGSSEYLTFLQRNTFFTNNTGTDGFEFLQSLPQPTGYLQWAQVNGVVNGPDGDDDEDNISNVIEFMLGLDPDGPSTLPPLVSATNGLTWTLPKYPAATEDGLIYQIQSNTDLQLWFAAGASGSGSTVVIDNAYTLSVRLNPGAVRRFMRLNVDSSPATNFTGRSSAPLPLQEVPVTTRQLPDTGYERSAFAPAFSAD